MGGVDDDIGDAGFAISYLTTSRLQPYLKKKRIYALKAYLRPQNRYYTLGAKTNVFSSVILSILLVINGRCCVVWRDGFEQFSG